MDDQPQRVDGKVIHDGTVYVRNARSTITAIMRRAGPAIAWKDTENEWAWDGYEKKVPLWVDTRSINGIADLLNSELAVIGMDMKPSRTVRMSIEDANEAFREAIPTSYATLDFYPANWEFDRPDEWACRIFVQPDVFESVWTELHQGATEVRVRFYVDAFANERHVDSMMPPPVFPWLLAPEPDKKRIEKAKGVVLSIQAYRPDPAEQEREVPAPPPVLPPDLVAQIARVVQIATWALPVIAGAAIVAAFR